MKKVKGLNSTNWKLQNSHGDIKHSLGNTVNNTVITISGARWVLELLGRMLGKVYDCLRVYISFTPESNIK